jgi:hypothetical protein
MKFAKAAARKGSDTAPWVGVLHHRADIKANVRRTFLKAGA